MLALLFLFVYIELSFTCCINVVLLFIILIQVSRIQANVLYKLLPKFTHLLREGVNLYITNPTIYENRSTLKHGVHPNKISLNYNTRVKKAVDSNGTANGFSFADYEAIYSQTLPTNVSIG